MWKWDYLSFMRDALMDIILLRVLCWVGFASPLFDFFLSSILLPSVVQSPSHVDSLWPHGLQHTRPSIPHHLLKFAQVHVHWIGDAIQLSHPLLPSSPSAFNLSQHRGLFQWISSLYQAAKILELQLQQESFQCVLRVDFLSDSLVLSCCPRDSQKSSLVPLHGK